VQRDQKEEAAKRAELDEIKKAINSLTNICYQIKNKMKESKKTKDAESSSERVK